VGHHRGAIREQNFALKVLIDTPRSISSPCVARPAPAQPCSRSPPPWSADAGDKKIYSEVIMTRRDAVPVGEDIGFLPGTEEEKMTPWMGALEDNLEC